MARLWPLWLLFWGLVSSVHAQDASVCNAASPCAQGCCSEFGSCGFGPAFCGDGCISNCDAVAECGQYGGGLKCPLSVCCSEYGFCGTTAEFCSKGCQSNCGQVKQPSCSVSNSADGLKRKIAYYELFGIDRSCDTMQPEAIPAGALTHIYLAFVNFDSDFEMVDTDGDLVARVVKLKIANPGLRVSVAVGGWGFNDPPTQTYFSDMTSTTPNRQKFIKSLIKYMNKYGLDGVDIDWEYPTAMDRGGSSGDTDNYVLLLADLREAFDAENPGWEITCTLPNSYWYLQDFNLPSMQKYLSWFNLMSYDLHGAWDKGNKFTGAYLRGHTNLTEIDQGLQLLWRVGVEPENVVLGMAFYGRSFSMTDPSCHGPDCTFSNPGNAGPCSDTPGILYYAEILSSNQSINSATFYDKETTTKYNVYDNNQWVSYDDQQSWADKMEYLTGHCLSGLMIWAIDQDSGQYDALASLLGADAAAVGLTQGGDMTDAQKDALALQYGAYTGQGCLSTQYCMTDDDVSEKGACPGGFGAVTTAHSPMQRPEFYMVSPCKKDSYHVICCPMAAMPKNCAWNGAPVRSEIGCGGTCGSDQFTLNTDTYIDAKGSKGPCYQGSRSLCCDSAAVLDQCTWTECQDVLDGDTLKVPSCPSGSKLQTSRYDDGNGGYCAAKFGYSSTFKNYGQQGYCCPTSDTPDDCHWTFDSTDGTFSPQKVCVPTTCPSGTVKYTTALYPPNEYEGGHTDCAPYQQLPVQDHQWSFCCAPPGSETKWPVDPKYLWEDPETEEGADVVWAYQDNFGNNNEQSSPTRKEGEDAYGEDPYGFVMLDGPPGSIDATFDSAFTVARRTLAEHGHRTLVKRDLMTRNRTALESVFEPASEVLHVFCNYPETHPKCQRIFKGGAVDTIIKLPPHVGEGPFARVVSMAPVHESYELPAHHVRARSADKVAGGNTVWRVEIDYDFAAIKRDDGPVNMRVDFTNMLDYWDDVTDIPARIKRRGAESEPEAPLEYAGWRRQVSRAKASHERLRRRQAEVMSGAVRTELENELAVRDEQLESAMERRWFGAFKAWLKKVTTVEASDKGYLPLAIKTSQLLYRGFVGCSRTNAKLEVYLDAEASMEATYAYYFSGALGGLVPTTTYAYVGVQPQVYLGLTVMGSARLEYRSPRVMLMPTISYPGLAVKGLAAVGPTLDLYGQIIGIVQISGTLQAGARYSLKKSEMYWPDNGEEAPQIEGFDESPEPLSAGLTPELQVSVEASADLDIVVTPEANLGITVGGGALFGKTLVEAQVAAYVNNTLRFHVQAAASGSLDSDSDLTYSYGVYLLYNIGFGGWASIVGYQWNVGSRNLFNTPKFITLYSNGDVSASTAPTRRGLEAVHRLARREWQPSDSSEPVFAQARIIGADGDILWSSGEDLVNISLPRRSAPEWQLDSKQAEFGAVPLLRRVDDDTESQSPDLDLGTLTCPPSKCGADPSSSSSPPSSNGLLTKRAVNCDTWTLPDFRYNCDTFVDVTLRAPSTTPGTAASSNVVGICNNIRQYFTKKGQPTTGKVLTWDSNNQDSRRKLACPSGTCTKSNNDLKSMLGVTSKNTLVSCDEFPFASSEEGGADTVRTCAPHWEQIIQGNCNGLLSKVFTNAAYFDDTTAAAQWISWKVGVSNGKIKDPWFQKSGTGADAWQRTAKYVSQIPQAVGIDKADYGPDTDGLYTGYYVRRNFTFGLAQPSTSAAGAWGVQPAQTVSGTAGNTPGVSDIICAINTFGQDKIYKQPTVNAYCATGKSSTKNGFTVPSFKGCTVTFNTAVVPVGNSKRGESGMPAGIIGMYHTWGVQSITFVDDDDVEADSDDVTDFSGTWIE